MRVTSAPTPGLAGVLAFPKRTDAPSGLPSGRRVAASIKQTDSARRGWPCRGPASLLPEECTCGPARAQGRYLITGPRQCVASAILKESTPATCVRIHVVSYTEYFSGPRHGFWAPEPEGGRRAM